MLPGRRNLEERAAKIFGRDVAWSAAADEALAAALHACGVRAGDTVVVPALAPPSTAEGVRRIGARPLVADLNPASLNLSASDLEVILNHASVRAIVALHYGGAQGSIEILRQLADRFDAALIEDATGAWPGCILTSSGSWRPAGAWGDAVLLRSADRGSAEGVFIAGGEDILRDVRAWQRQVPRRSELAFLSGQVQTARVLNELARAEEAAAARRLLASLYRDRLAPLAEWLDLPAEPAHEISATSLFPVRLRLDRLSADRSRVIEDLRQRGVFTSVHWMPLHIQPSFVRAYGASPRTLPVASAVWPRLLSLPLHSSLEPARVNDIVSALADVVRHYAHSPRSFAAGAAMWRTTAAQPAD
jgi:perosamine synthetase